MDHKHSEGYKITELGDIPQEWEVKSVEELINQNIVLGVLDGNHGAIHPKSSDYVKFGVPFIMANNIVNNELDLIGCKFISEEQSKKLRKGFAIAGDVLLTHKGTVGLTAIVPDTEHKYIVLTPQVTYYRVRKDNGTLLNRYLKYYFDSKLFQDVLKSASAQSTRDYIGITAQKKLNIVLPTLPEQQKIADILSTVDNHIGQTDVLIEKKKELKKGLMQRLLTNGVGHTEFKQTEIGEIPAKWDVKQLNDLANKLDKHSFTGGPFGSDLKSCHYTENGVRIIQLQNIGDGYFDDAYAIYTSEEKADELKNCNIYPHEVIIAKMADPVARACRIPGNEKRYLMCSDGIRLSVDENLHDSDYVMYAINSCYFRKNAIANSTGTTRLRIGLNELKGLPIAVPPLEEQKKIALILLTVDQKISELIDKKKSLLNLKQGLMQKMLTGKVRVKV